MATSSKRTVAVSVADPVADHCQPPPPLVTSGHSRASLAQSLVGSLLLSPGSWCTRFRFEPVFPQPCRSCVCKPHWPSGSDLLWAFSPFAGAPGWEIRTFATVQELLWDNCSPVCGSPAQWLYIGANGNLLQEDLCRTLRLPGLLQPEPLSPWPATADWCLCRRHSKVQSLVRVTASFPWVLVTQGLVCTL